MEFKLDLDKLMSVRPSEDRAEKNALIKDMLQEVGMTDQELFEIVEALLTPGQVKEVTRQEISLQGGDHSPETRMSFGRFMNSVDEDVYQALVQKLLFMIAAKISVKPEKDRLAFLSRRSKHLRMLWSKLRQDENGLPDFLKHYLLESGNNASEIAITPELIAVKSGQQLNIAATLILTFQAEAALLAHAHRGREEYGRNEERHKGSFFERLIETVEKMTGIAIPLIGSGMGSINELSQAARGGGLQAGRSSSGGGQAQSQRIMQSVILVDIINDKQAMLGRQQDAVNQAGQGAIQDAQSASQQQPAQDDAARMLRRLQRRVDRMRRRGQMNENTFRGFNAGSELKVQVDEKGQAHLSGAPEALKDDRLVMQTLKKLDQYLERFVGAEGEKDSGKNIGDKPMQAMVGDAPGIKALIALAIKQIAEGITDVKERLILQDVLSDKALFDKMLKTLSKKEAMEKMNAFLAKQDHFIKAIEVDPKTGALALVVSTETLGNTTKGWLEDSNNAGQGRAKPEEEKIIGTLKQGETLHDQAMVLVKLHTDIRSSVLSKRLEILDALADLNIVLGMNQKMQQILQKEGGAVAEVVQAMHSMLKDMPEGTRSVQEMKARPTPAPHLEGQLPEHDPHDKNAKGITRG